MNSEKTNRALVFWLFCAWTAVFSQQEPLPYGPIAVPLPDTLDQLYRDSATIQIGRVRVNQAGYRPGDPKWIYYIGQATQFTVISEGKAVGTGALTPTGQSSSSSLSIRASNNASLVANGDTRYTMASETVSGPVQEGKLPELPEGVYRVVVGADTSVPFIIDPRVYSMVKDALLKFFGVQRSGNSDSWFHPPSHLKDGLQGGWYDCGDHLKEGITQSYAMMVLGLAAAAFYDRDTDHYGRNQTHTLTTDGIPDLLYETKHGADYVLASYDLAGGNIANMITSVGDFSDHMWWGSPEYQDNMQPVRGGPPRFLRRENSSPQFGRWAAGLAFFSRKYAPYDKVYADKALKVARELYTHAIAVYRSQNSPAYSGDNTIYDDLALAAVALAWATGEKKYLDDALRNEALGSWPQETFLFQPKGSFKSGWFARANGSLLHGGTNTSFGSVQVFGLWALYKLILKDSVFSASLGITEPERILFIEDVAYSLIRNITDVGLGDATIDLPDPSMGVGIVTYNSLWKHMFTVMEWVWNRYQAGNITELYLYYDVARDIQGSALPNTPASTDWKADEVLELVIRQMDYMLGVNPWDVSMVFGIGDKTFNHPHHRAANPEGKNVPGGFYRYRPPVGALQGSYTPNAVNAYKEFWGDYFHSEVCLDGTATLLLPTVGLALQEDLAGGPELIVEIEHVGYDKAFIRVRQNKYGTTTLSYGTAANKAALAQKLVSKHGVIHRFELTGLLPGTTYYFDAEAVNTASGKTTLENNKGKYYTFTTSIQPNGPAQIENITVCNITHNSAQVLWFTPNGEYQSKVKWSEQPLPYGQMPNSKEGDDGGIPTRFHMVTIEGLKEQTTYYYGVESNGKIITQDNSGKPLQFTTPVEHVNFDLRTLAYNFGEIPFFGIIMVNQDPKAYDSLEFRLYLTGTEEEMSITQAMPSQQPPVDQWELMARLDIGIKYRPDGFQDKHFKGIVEQQLKTAGLVRIEDSYNPATGEWDWYFPINLGEATMESGARFRLDIGWTPRTSWYPYLDYGAPGPVKHVPSKENGDWSFRLHNRADGDPVDFGGVKTGVKTNLDDDYWNLEINPYIAVYRKGEFIWGYSPSAKEQATKRAHYEIDMALEAPFDGPSGTHIAMAGPNDTVMVQGKAKITENGFVTDIWANGKRVEVTDKTARYDFDTDLWILNIPVELNSGGNNIDLTVFAGPDPVCTACLGNAGCAFENRSFFLEYAITGRYASLLSLKENGANIPSPFLAVPGKTAFTIEVKDSTAPEQTTLPVSVHNTSKTFQTFLILNKTGERIFTSPLLSITSEELKDKGPLKFSLPEGDTLWVTYRDSIDWRDTATKFIQVPATFPQAKIGYFQDADSNGTVEVIKVLFNKKLNNLPDSLQIGTALTLRARDGHVFSSDNQFLLIKLIKAIPPPVQTTGTVFLSSKGKTRSDVFSFAPFILSARIFLNPDTSSGDTLVLSFPYNITLDGAPQFYIMGNKNAGQTLNVASILGNTGKSLTLLVTPLSASRPRIGDRIHIASGIVDGSGNSAGPHNPWCFITGTPLPPPVPPAKLISGHYLDNNRDGVLDQVMLAFDTLVDVSKIAIRILWDEAELNETVLSLSAVDATHLSFNLEAVAGGKRLPLQTRANITVQDRYGAVSLADSAKPILISAEIIPPLFPRYILSGDLDQTLHTNPDTLKILLSESLKRPAAQGAGVEKPVFHYTDGFQAGCGTVSPKPLVLEPEPPPEITNVYSPLSNSGGHLIPKIGDCLIFNKQAELTDLAGNSPYYSGVEIQGQIGDNDGFKTSLFVPLMSGTPAIQDSFNLPEDVQVPVLDSMGSLVGTITPTVSTQWILPRYMNEKGEINRAAQSGCSPAMQLPELKPFPKNCISAVYVLSDGPYTADISIFDNLGKHIYSSVQQFGYCGELQEPAHIQPGGYLSFLVWNQKDTDKNYVGSGVYIWRVKYLFGNGKKRLKIYKQGIARGLKPAQNCSVE